MKNNTFYILFLLSIYGKSTFAIQKLLMVTKFISVVISSNTKSEKPKVIEIHTNELTMKDPPGGQRTTRKKEGSVPVPKSKIKRNTVILTIIKHFAL